MQKIVLLLITALFYSATYAQDNAVTKYFSAYEQDASFTNLNVTKKTFSLFNEIEAKSADEKNVLNAIAKLNGIKVLHKEVAEEVTALYKDAERKILGDVNYEELMSVRDGSDNVLFMIREDKETVKELLLVVGADEEFVLASLFGEIDLKSMSQLASVIKRNGPEWFEIFEDIDSDELVFGGASSANAANQGSLLEKDLNLKVFPNPAVDFVRIETLDGKDGTFEMEFFSTIGEPVTKAKNISLPYQLELKDLPTGAYFLRLTDSNGNFKNIRIVKN